MTGITTNRKEGDLVASDTTATGIPPIQDPNIGIRFATPTTTPSTNQNGMCTAHSPMVASTPTAADTIKRARTKPATILRTSPSGGPSRSLAAGGIKATTPRAVSGSESSSTNPRNPPAIRINPA